MKVLSMATRRPRPKNLYSASAAPSGKPIMLAMSTAVRLTCSDRVTISIRSPSNCMISQIAFEKA